ncbi:MAG: hypothetical protein B6244_08705 [Candidatus Cloacimonetes bacterium 4572_55]|nr:MAG: hypothetical protein B6244_08705 [Candidatus Cloacimonetes bacterium 4572_55]
MLEPNSSLYSQKIRVVARLTMLWAFSESVIGGVLHAVGIPIKGMALAGLAVLFISMIGRFSDRRGDILQATITVLLVKGLISPHSPFAAYFSVFIQGCLGELIFSAFGVHRFSTIVLGAINVSFSSVQKIFMLTILFGINFWEALNQGSAQLIRSFFGVETEHFITGLMILYVTIYFIAGIIAGWIAWKLPRLISDFSNSTEFRNFHSNILSENLSSDSDWGVTKRKKPSFLRRYRFYVPLLIIISCLPILLTGVIPPGDVLYILIRSFLILGLWSIFFSKNLLRFTRKYLFKTKKSRYQKQVDEIIQTFPKLNSIYGRIWKSTSDCSILYRLRISLFYLLAVILFDVENSENSEEIEKSTDGAT